jgi:hypothetical protein
MLSNSHHEDERHADRTFVIHIDGVRHQVHQTGLQLKTLADKDTSYLLFEEVPGHKDRLINNDDLVEMKEGLRFYTEPAGTYG